MAKKPLSFNQKLSIFIGTTILLMILSVALIVVLTKQGTADKIFTQFYKDYAGQRVEQDKRAQLADAQALIKKDPKNPEGYAKRAECYEGLNESELALKDYNQAISLDPTKAEWYHARGQVWDSDDYHKAIQDFSKAIELKPQKEYYFKRAETYANYNQSDKALPDLEEALKLGYPAAIVHERRGEAFTKASELDKAIDAFKKSIASPDDEEIDGSDWETRYSKTRSYRQLANVYAALNDFDSAFEQATAWIKRDPSDEEGYFLRARFYRALGDLVKEKADENSGIACLAKQIDSYPSAFNYQCRAKAYKRIGKIKEANSDFRKAIDCFKKEISDDRRAKNYYESEIDSITEELGEKPEKKDCEKEIAEFSRKIAAKPNDADLYSERAALYEDAKQPALALRDYEAGKKLSPEDSSFGMQIGQILITQKKYDEAAREYAELAKGEEGKSSWVFSKMAHALELAGKHDEAIKSADKAIELDPLTGDGYYWRSKAFESKGDKERAKASMTQAIALDFDE